MKYELIEQIGKDKTVIFTHTDKKEIIKQLSYNLWLKYIAKIKFRKVKYNYNYSDMQTIEFIDVSEPNKKFIHKFSDIPTMWGILNTDKIDI